MFLLDFSQIDWTSYSPGQLEQDLVTIPLEAAATWAITAYAPDREEARWPFRGEKTDGDRNPSRHTNDFGVPMVAGIAVPVLVGMESLSSDFPMGVHIRGWVHAHILTELVTISAKKGFQRHRPFYDTELASRRARVSDRHSFFSGHTSHAFATATYASLLVHEYLPNPAAAWVLSGLFYAGASWVGSARALDGQHHWSDVAAGAVAGTLMTAFVFHRVVNAQEERLKLSAGPSIDPEVGTLGLEVRGSFSF